MSDVEYVVNFGSDKSIQFVKLSMAGVEHHGARLAEPIVRCRDCEYFCSGYFGDECFRMSYLYDPSGTGDDVAVGGTFKVAPDGFCALGKRKAVRA